MKGPGNLIRPLSTIKRPYGQRIISPTRTWEAMIYLDLGYIVINTERHSKLEAEDVTTVLEQDDY